MFLLINPNGSKLFRMKYRPETTPTAQEEDPWSMLEKVLVELYPFGPWDQEVWSRAGGDLSRLQFHPLVGLLGMQRSAR